MNRTETFSEKLMRTLHRIRLPLLIGTIVFILVLVGVLVFVEVSNARSQRAILTVEDIQEDLDDWEDNDKDPEVLATIKQDLQNVVEKYPREYGTLRAMFMLGNIAWEQEEYAESSEMFLKLSKTFPNSHLTPTALYNAASAQQNNDDDDGAYRSLEQIVQNYPDSIVTPQSLFSLARISEQKSEYMRALEQYQELIDDYPSSKWAQIAHTRKIQLRIDGHVTEE